MTPATRTTIGALCLLALVAGLWWWRTHEATDPLADLLVAEVAIGDTVKVGDLVATIDGVTQENDLKSAEAALADVRAQTRQKEASLVYAEAVLERETATLTLLIAAIVVISLVVGGIGVMNIMLVSVSERVKEIGVRMAVGARRSDILRQFLTEAVLVCLIGGVLGVAFAVLGSIYVFVYSATTIVAAFACSTLIGVVFGWLPAHGASLLDPVAALARD